MTYNVLMGTLNPTHSLTRSLGLHRCYCGNICNIQRRVGGYVCTNTQHLAT